MAFFAAWPDRYATNSAFLGFSRCAATIGETEPMADASLSGWMRALIEYVRSGEPDLTNRQMAMLMLVYLTPGPHTVRGLAKTLGVSKPVVTRALNSLGGLGYLRRERDQDDRRNVFVVRTNDGAEFLEGFKKYLRAGDENERRAVEQRSKEPAFAGR
jgi:DNA-binding MarR family transcriptional regulator